MFTTLSSFISKNNLSISKTDLIHIALIENINIIPSGIKYNENNLEELMIKYHCTCLLSIKDENIDTDKKLKYIYLMKIYDSNNNFTNKCKIGIAEEPEKRAKHISKKSNFIFKVHKVSKLINNAYEIEQVIHKLLILKELKYEANNNFDGSTELFIYKEWLDNLVL